MSCLYACHDEPRCISYNFFKENKTCEINSSGIKKQCDSKSVIFSRGWIFHQIRPVPEEKPEPELGDDPSKPAKSCQEIFTERNVASGAYYIKPHDQTSLIYCKMENTPECGDGGWTLAMKINGSKATFKYSSELWTNTNPYNEAGGKDLSNTETKFAFFATATFQEGLCVGMKVNGTTKWLKIPKRINNQLFGIFSAGNSDVKLNIERSKWKSLINGSSMHNGCSTAKEGFNFEDSSAKVRIGMIGYKNCGGGGEATSRIGFGTEGSSGGMDSSNSCGNEATSGADNGEKSIKAFCYIFIK
ncbi:hypothetical protein ACROYT_G007535 [Oculina patagonica]